MISRKKLLGSNELLKEYILCKKRDVCSEHDFKSMATLVFRMRKKKLQFHCQIGLVGSYITTHARSFFECWLPRWWKLKFFFLDQTRTWLTKIFQLSNRKTVIFFDTAVLPKAWNGKSSHSHLMSKMPWRTWLNCAMV